MQIYSVYKNNCFGINEQCLKNTDGDFIGIKTGDIYKGSEHYSRPQLLAKIISADNDNETGMYHLYSGVWGEEGHEENKKSWKRKYIGCIVTVEKAHYADELPIYLCLELEDYFSGNEIELL